ncbi:MAG: hypothetical protein OHK0044_17850 [Burkholderiaceae bacterium]
MRQCRCNAAWKARQRDVLDSGRRGAAKGFAPNLACETAGRARAATIVGAGGGPASAMDLNLSPDLSVVRVANADANRKRRG